MNKKDKELLLKDLSSRLPYGVKVKIESEDSAIESGTLVGMTRAQKHDTIIYEDLVCLAGVLTPFRLEEVKPYLRSIDSMTKEEYKQFEVLWSNADCTVDMTILLDWFNAHHFDSRCLLERGLAILVTEDNNPYK